MKAIKKVQNRFTTERAENLMLMVLYAEQSIRDEALAELKGRRDDDCFEPLPDGYTTNMGIIPC